MNLPYNSFSYTSFKAKAIQGRGKSHAEYGNRIEKSITAESSKENKSDPEKYERRDLINCAKGKRYNLKFLLKASCSGFTLIQISG